MNDSEIVSPREFKYGLLRLADDLVELKDEGLSNE